MLEIVFSNEFLLVKTAPEKSLIYWEWTSQDSKFTDDSFLEHCKILLNLVIEFRFKYAIENAIDSRFVISVELQEKYATEILDKIPEDCLIKFAIVNSTDEVVSMSNELWYEEVGEQVFQQRFFTNLEAAESWIEQYL